MDEPVKATVDADRFILGNWRATGGAYVQLWMSDMTILFVKNLIHISQGAMRLWDLRALRSERKYLGKCQFFIQTTLFQTSEATAVAN